MRAVREGGEPLVSGEQGRQVLALALQVGGLHGARGWRQ